MVDETRCMQVGYEGEELSCEAAHLGPRQAARENVAAGFCGRIGQGGWEMREEGGLQMARSAAPCDISLIDRPFVRKISLSPSEG